MVEIGGRPILWHIMKIYAHHGIKDFIICLGYKGIDDQGIFLPLQSCTCDVTIDMRNGMTVHQSVAEDWRITLVETGLETQTGGRLKRVARYLGDDALFCMTYGDAVADIDIKREIAFHKAMAGSRRSAAVQPPRPVRRSRGRRGAGRPFRGKAERGEAG